MGKPEDLAPHFPATATDEISEEKQVKVTKSTEFTTAENVSIVIESCGDMTLYHYQVHLFLFR